MLYPHLNAFLKKTFTFDNTNTKVSPFTIPALLGNTASGVIGIECGCQGPNYGVTSACASGGHAIGKNYLLYRKCEEKNKENIFMYNKNQQ